MRPECPYETEEMDAATGIEYLKLHSSQVHGVANKPEKPKKPTLEMTGSCVDVLDWEAFIHKFSVYKNLSGIPGDAASYLLDCLSREVYNVLFSTYGESVSKQNEKTLKDNIKRLVVRKRNKLLTVMELLNLHQESDERILSFLSRLKAKARQCALALDCTCGLSVDFTDQITLYMLVAGISDQEIQEDLLAVDTLTLADAESKAVAKESAKFSQSEMSGEKINKLRSTYQKAKSQGNLSTKLKCHYCGGNKHSNRETECKAYGATCNRCGKKGHFKNVCKSKKTSEDIEKVEKQKDTTVDGDQDNHIVEGLFNVEEQFADQQTISSLVSGDLKYDKKRKIWIQKPLADKLVEKVPIELTVCGESWVSLGSKCSAPSNQILVEGVADTGCSVLCGGIDICRKFKMKQSQLLKSKVTLRVADGRQLTVIGCVPVDVSVAGSSKKAKYLLHVVQELKDLFISKSCLKDLGIISPFFPWPHSKEDLVESIDCSDTAPCGCPRRTKVPDPPSAPVEPTEENVPKLKEFIMQYYASSTMNLCSHQLLPEVSGPPLHFVLKPDYIPVAVHTPASIPIHWTRAVKEQLDRDVEMGILELVPPDEPTVWQHRMVIVRKPNGTPRRTVDMQSLNKATLRQSYPLTSPYQKAMTVPTGVYKTVTDAWEGFHAIPLDEESSKLTQFITPFGVYRYKRGPQGFQATMDAYNRRFDKVTEGVKDIIRQVDDSLLWDTSIKGNFDRTVAFLTLLGRNGILQNPDKFQFCSKEVHWSGFLIGEDTVKPMPHLTSAIRNFPQPKNKTDLRSFMALAQQVSYSTAVAPLLLPFRKLIKDGTPWDWPPELDKIFRGTCDTLADKVEDGIKMFDPYKITALLTDWCKHGVGFLLMQKHCRCLPKTSGEINPLCCKEGWKVTMVGSRFTIPAEANYYPTEGEMLGVCNALHKTKYFTLGCPHLYVGTDHKPLLGLLNDTAIEKIDNPRLVRLKEKTLGWQFNIIYIPGKRLGGTDALSRYGVRHSECISDDDSGVTVRKHLIGLLAESSSDQICLSLDEVLSSVKFHSSPIGWEDIKEATREDQELQEVIKWLNSGCIKNAIPDSVKHFQSLGKQLVMSDGVLMYNQRIVVPSKYRQAILDTLHSSHQGVTGMILRAEDSVFWPNISRDIKLKRQSCRICDVYAPSHADMPPVQPDVPTYPFQHICSDYFQIHGKEYCVVVDRFSGWFNIFQAKDGARGLVAMFTRLFQDAGVPETLTTDGGTTYVSAKFQEFLATYKVHHRVSSVGFPHGNTRSEVAVKSAKRLLRENTSITGDLDNVAVTKALLQHRNTPDRDIGMSPAELLYGRKLKDFLPGCPSKYIRPQSGNMRQEWNDIAQWRELALAKRCSKVLEKLSEHVKDLPALKVGDLVAVQNQLGNNPRRWDRRGVIVEVLPHRQYKILLDGSRRLTLRNRKFIRLFKPLQPVDDLSSNVDVQRKAAMQEVKRSEQARLRTAASKPAASVTGGTKPAVTETLTTELSGKPTSTNETDSEQSLPNLLFPGYEDTINREAPQFSTETPGIPPEDHGVPSPTQQPALQTPQYENAAQGYQEYQGNESPEAEQASGPPVIAPRLRRSSRRPSNMPIRYEDFYTGHEYDEQTSAVYQADWGGGCSQYALPYQEEIVDYIYAIPLLPSFSDCIAWWTGSSWEWWTV